MAIALVDICTLSVITKLAEEDKQLDVPRPLSAQDAWIAATAVRHDLPLVISY